MKYMRMCSLNFFCLVCITAPHVAIGRGEENDVNSTAGGSELRGWWFTRAGQHFYSRDGPDHSIDFQPAVDFISKTCELEGPFDGILGFSQGACMVSLICAMQQSGGEFIFYLKMKI